MSPVGDRTLAQQLSGAFVLFGRLVAGAFILTVLSYASTWVWLTPEREQNQLAIRTKSAAHTAMLDEEVGLRGFLLTHDARFLEPYQRGQADLVRANELLTRYVGDVAHVPEIATSLVETRLAEEAWRERWANLAAVSQAGETPPPLAEGKRLFDAYRAHQAAFSQALIARGEELSRREQLATGLRVALELAVFLAVLILSLRQYRALRSSIVAPVAGLLQYIECMRDGLLSTAFEPSGPRELRQLGERLNEMVRALAMARDTAASRDELVREHSGRLREILDASREFSESLKLSYVVAAVIKSTAAVGGYHLVTVWLMDDAGELLVDAARDPGGAPGASALEVGQGLAGRAAKSGRITFERPDGQVRFNDKRSGPVCAIAVPLIVGARIVGALEARHLEPRAASTQAIEVLEMLAVHAATALESARLHEITEERSEMDALTRLFNRRRLDDDLDAECKRSVRYSRPLSFVMLDVDHFKACNDTYGHPKADTALQALAEVLLSCVRSTDTAYRYGGEEFCILLRETCARDALLFAERVRQRIQERFASGETPGITASFGVAGFGFALTSPRALVEAADKALFESKRGGRNRVEPA